MPLFDHLYNFAHWLTQNRDEAEDLVQETYAKALKGFSSFQLGTSFRAWMYRILRNTFLTSRTGLRVTMTVPLDLDADGPELAVGRARRRQFCLNAQTVNCCRVRWKSCPCIFGRSFSYVKSGRCRTRRLPKRFLSP